MGSYKYTKDVPGNIIVDGKDVILQKNETVTLPDDNKDVIRLTKMKYLNKVNTTPAPEKKSDKA